VSARPRPRPRRRRGAPAPPPGRGASAPPPGRGASAPPPGRGGPAPPPGRVAAAALACLALAAASLLLPWSLAYDAWAWLVWGRELTRGELHTVLGPSWKPLPLVVTAPGAALGDGVAPLLWLAVARAGALGAVVVAVRLGARVAGLAAGLAGGLLLACSPWLWADAALGNSEGLLLLALLGAVDRWWAGRRGQAFALLGAAALLRPEAWPFLGLAALVLVREDRARLRWVAGGLLLVPVLWLAPEWVASGNPLRAADVAQAVTEEAPGAQARPALAVLAEAVGGLPVGALAGLALLAALAAGARRRAPGARPLRARALDLVAAAGRPGSALGLALLGLAWLSLVAAMAEAGFSGRLRYSAPALAVGCVLAGVGLARAAARLRDRPVRPARGAAALVATATVAVALAAAGAEMASSAPQELRELRHRAALREELGVLVRRAGGAQALVRCGTLSTHPAVITLVAWTLDTRISDVGAAPVVPGAGLRARAQRERPAAPPQATVAARPDVVTPRWALERACR